MSKRIFSKVFAGAISAQTDPFKTFTVANAIESWLAQEDIEVIGADITLVNQYPSENDGFAMAIIELSQVGIFGQDGAILAASAAEGWNTTPAGIDQANANVAVNFPLGLAVPVKEEGYLYINGAYVGKTAGLSAYQYVVIVYYTKKGSR